MTKVFSRCLVDVAESLGARSLIFFVFCCNFFRMFFVIVVVGIINIFVV